MSEDADESIRVHVQQPRKYSECEWSQTFVTRHFYVIKSTQKESRATSIPTEISAGQIEQDKEVRDR